MTSAFCSHDTLFACFSSELQEKFTTTCPETHKTQGKKILVTQNKKLVFQLRYVIKHFFDRISNFSPRMYFGYHATRLARLNDITTITSRKTAKYNLMFCTN